VVAYDDDLLTLGKPFGVAILKPETFLRLLKEEK